MKHTIDGLLAAVVKLEKQAAEQADEGPEYGDSMVVSLEVTTEGARALVDGVRHVCEGYELIARVLSAAEEAVWCSEAFGEDRIRKLRLAVVSYKADSASADESVQ